MSADVGTIQSQLTLDFKDFSAGMRSATNLVKTLGKQLQKALGTNAAQGFSTTNKAITSIRQNIVKLQAATSTFAADMRNANTSIKQFTAIKNNTSALGNSIKDASKSAKTLDANTSPVAPKIKNAEAAAKKLSANLSTSGTNAKKANTEVKGTATAASKAEKNADKLAKNINNASSFARDLKRIVSGIVISQTFYRLLGVMTDLVSASVDFMNNMAQSSIAFKYLLGSASEAKTLLTQLQDFAIASPLDMSGATNSARMLMTMGFQAKSVVSVLGTITDAATVAGGDMESTVDRISLALGQMLQSGTVKMQEVRQLVNANIPIYDILREQLGLTAAQISDIGNEGVDSGKAVTAILVGLQKRFAGAGKEMQTTIPGALSAIKDSFYTTFDVVMKGPYEAFRLSLVSLSDRLQYLAVIARKLGAGGVFNNLIPARLQPMIRNLVGAFGQLGTALQYVGRIALQIFGAMGEIILNALNIVLPPISIIVNAIAQLAYVLMQTFPFLKYFAGALVLFSIARPIGMILLWFWKIIGLGAILTKITGYIGNMIKWLGVLGTACLHHPLIAFLVILAIALLTLTGNTQKAINKIKEMFSLLGSSMTGANKTINGATNLGYDPNTIAQPSVVEASTDAQNYSGTLADLAKQLDAVSSSADDASNAVKEAFNQSFDEVYNIDPSKSSDLGLSGLNDIDLSGAVNTLGDLNGALGDLQAFDFDSSWADGFMNSWASMWDDIKKRISSFTGWSSKQIDFAAIGAIIGGIIGSSIAPGIGTAIGAALGATVGAAVSSLVDLFQYSWKEIGWSLIQTLWPVTLEVFTAATMYFDKAFKAENFWDFGANIILGIAAGIVGGFIAINESILQLFKLVVDSVCSFFGIASPATAMMPYGRNILLGILEGIIGALGEIPAYIGQVAVAVLASTRDGLGNVKTNIFTFFADTRNNIQGFVVETGANIVGWAVRNGSTINNWASNTRSSIGNWVGNTSANIASWVDNTSSNMGIWWSNVSVRLYNLTGFSFSSWCDNSLSNISNWASSVWSVINDNLGSAIDKIKDFLGISSGGSSISINSSFRGNASFGHAAGGVFNREHWAQFAEGNKAEAIIPLQNNSAMQPFVDAVATGITTTLAPIMAAMSGSSTSGKTPIYVQTMIADTNGIKELERKLYEVRIQEEGRS